MKRLFKQLLLLITLSCWGLGGVVHARTWSLDSMPEDLDQVDIYLHTVNVGNLIFNNFGHTAIRVHDRLSGRDLVFNWGMFDFGHPISFALKFYKGILIYKLGVYPYALVIESYRDEQRTVWEDKFDLDREQKRILLDRLIWNSRPENRDYAYQYFYDNCSTRPRDYIDEAVDKKLQPATQQSLSPDSFRDMMMKGYQYNPGVDLFLDIVMNSRLDHKISLWERMFHPLYLRDVLLKTPIDGKPILIPGTILVEFPGPNAYPGLSYPLVLTLFGIPLALIGLMLMLRRRKQQTQPWLYRLWALISLPVVSFGALLGFLMPLTWLVSAHLDLHHNAHMWLFWPLDWLLPLALLKILWTGRPLTIKNRGWPWVRNYMVLHLLVSLLLPILRILSVIQQDVDRSVVYVLPLYLVSILLLYRLGFRSKRLERWEKTTLA